MYAKLKGILVILLILTLVLTTIGCTNQNPDDVDPGDKETFAQAYEEMLDRIYVWIDSGILSDSGYYYENGEEIQGLMGVMEVAHTMNMNKTDALEHIGYTVQDVTGDGICELLIGGISEKADELGGGDGNDTGRGDQIYTAYTVKEGKPQFVFEGWYRNSYSYMGEGNFFYQGSASAAQSGFGVFQLSEDGTELLCKNFYFTDNKDEETFEIGFYQNKKGEWDKDASTELKISDDEFWALSEDMKTQVKSIELTPFSSRATGEKEGTETPGKTEKPENNGTANVQVQWLEDDEASDYDVIRISEEEPVSHILFTTDRTVKLFTVLDLSLENVSEDGTATFDAYPASVATDILSPEEPVAVALSFFGTIPNYGFQYEDTDGNTRRFALEISGKDGSLIFREANPEYYKFVLSAE